nr:hypothetical protein [Tanacetum cinerariifolium]
MLAISATDKPVVFKAPKTSSKAESVSQGTKPRAQTGHKKPLTSLKQPSKAPTGSKTSHSKKKKESSSAMDSNPSQPPVFTPVDTRMHKEDQQATRGPTSLGVISEARANPRLNSRNDALAASTAEPDPGNSAPSDFVPQKQDSAKDDPVIVVTDSDEDEDDESQQYKLELEKNKADAEAALLKAQASFPNVEQLKELLVKSLKTVFSNILSAHDIIISLPIKLKDLLSKFNDLPKEGEHIKKDKGKKALSLEEAMKESTESDSNDDETHLLGSIVKSSRIKKVKKFDFVIKDGKHIHLTEEQINQQKKIKEKAKAKAAKRESEVRKEELIDLLGLKDPLNKLNDLANKKRKHADDIHDYFKANKRLKSPVQYEDHLPSTVLNEPVLEIFCRLHQGPRLDDHARTCSPLLLAEIDKRNLNPLK